MENWRQNSTTVSRLRVGGNEIDPLASRLRFERLFGAANFHPAGLPPSAIVCVKKLSAPAPEKRRFGFDDWQLSLDWQSGVRNEIEKLFRRAFRPSRETVPAQAESVVFADDSELLASLASDWCEGLLAQRWWWQSLFPGLRQAQTVARIWIEAAEFAPNALKLLAKQGKAVKFAVKLQPLEANDLLRQMIRVFGLNDLQKALFEPLSEKEEFTFEPLQNFIKKRDRFNAVTETRHAALDFERQCLLGIGLLLARAPRVARSAEFARQTRLFRAKFEFSRKIAAQSIDKILGKAQQYDAIEQQKIISSASPSAKTKTSPNPPVSKKTEQKSSAKSSFVIKKDSLKFTVESIESSDSAETLKAENRLTEKAEKKLEAAEIEKKSKTSRIKQNEFFKSFDEIIEEPETAIELSVETEFGGIFYLLNLGLYLNLYRDFSEFPAREIDLNIWDFVALLGLEFLGEKIKNDAVWKLLERLSGRETEAELGEGFNPPDEWRMPPEWLETFQTNQKWLWTISGKRLVIRHPEKFSVVNAPLAADFQSQLAEELKIYQKGISDIVENDAEDFSQSLSKSWLKNLAEYARKRLAKALNLPAPEQINEILFERKAKISVTATHLDITFSLADLPFEVRLSGLDRNPGWIPAAGKYVKFHFV